jgi:hypothetical protein
MKGKHMTSQTCKLCHQDLSIEKFELMRSKTYRKQCKQCRHLIKKQARHSKKEKVAIPVAVLPPPKTKINTIIPIMDDELETLLKHLMSVAQNLLNRVSILEQKSKKTA